MSTSHDSDTLRRRYDTASARLAPPFAIVDLEAFDANATDMRKRAAGLPIRVASKSVRCRQLLRRVLELPGYRGVFAFSLAEALWLVDSDVSQDIVVGYPSADQVSLRRLVTDPQAAAAITLMVDDEAQLDYIDSIVPAPQRETLRLCIDLDASWRPFGSARAHLGVRRSPVHAPIDVVRLAKKILARDGFTPVGLMSYEAQIAGIGQRGTSVPPLVRTAQHRSFRELRVRRGKAVAALRAMCDLDFVNAGGTGSLEMTATDPSVTELTAGSGLYAPALFDDYDAFQPRPAAAFALSVVRRPDAAVATLHGGGWIASGAPGVNRLPRPWLPDGLRVLPMEGAGEVQTPVSGPGAHQLRVGDRVWFRHAKAGELCERVNELHLISHDTIADTVPTYRGEGRAFL